MNNQELGSTLDQLVLDNPELERLEAIVDTFNPFVAMRWTRQEVKHSTFLSWLLNPRETHGLGSYCLRTFLKRVARYSAASPTTPSVIEIDSWNLDRAVITAEWRGIDILVQDDANQFVAVFENKIDSGEHSDQLRRYAADIELHFPQHKKLFSYLTIEGDPPTDEGYIPIGYVEIAQFIRDTLDRRGEQVGPDVRSFLGHYVEMVRRHIVEDSEIQQLCRAIYAKHQKALDLIFEHRPDRAGVVSDTLQAFVGSRTGVLKDHCSKSYVRFFPESWDGLPKGGVGWTSSKRMLLFELDISKGGMFLKLVLGPGDETLRQALQPHHVARRDGLTDGAPGHGRQHLSITTNVLLGVAQSASCEREFHSRRRLVVPPRVVHAVVLTRIVITVTLIEAVEHSLANIDSNSIAVHKSLAKFTNSVLIPGRRFAPEQRHALISCVVVA